MKIQNCKHRFIQDPFADGMNHEPYCENCGLQKSTIETVFPKEQTPNLCWCNHPDTSHEIIANVNTNNCAHCACILFIKKTE